MSGIVSRAELLRPWADAPCPGPSVEATSHEIDCKGGCAGTGLDPRFDALRGEHETLKRSIVCRYCGEVQGHWNESCLRTDLGALVRVAAACGLWQIFLEYDGGSAMIHAETPEDALAAALVAALPEPS